MSRLIAALPMYDWPETRRQTDMEWQRLRDFFRAEGIEAPETIVRRNADMPAVPGGIRDAEGRPIAPDPATLPTEGFDLPTLWRHPDLLIAQTCWGPLELGLLNHVKVVGQPSYDGFEGGQGPYYSSALLMRKVSGDAAEGLAASPDGTAQLPLDRLRGARLAFNSAESMSGLLALTRDLESTGENLDSLMTTVETGSHRASMIAIAEGKADVCAIDCRSWHMAKRLEPMAAMLDVVGWTSMREGLPMITSRHTAPAIVATLREILAPH